MSEERARHYEEIRKLRTTTTKIATRQPNQSESMEVEVTPAPPTTETTGDSPAPTKKVRITRQDLIEHSIRRPAIQGKITIIPDRDLPPEVEEDLRYHEPGERATKALIGVRCSFTPMVPIRN